MPFGIINDRKRAQTGDYIGRMTDRGFKGRILRHDRKPRNRKARVDLTIDPAASRKANDQTQRVPDTTTPQRDDSINLLPDLLPMDIADTWNPIEPPQYHPTTIQPPSANVTPIPAPAAPNPKFTQRAITKTGQGTVSWNDMAQDANEMTDHAL